MKEYNEEFIQYSKEKAKDEKNHFVLYFVVHITLYIFLFFFLLFFTWYSVFICTHKFYAVYGISMKNTFNSQLENYAPNADKISYDAVYIDKYGSLKINDIIVLKQKGEAGKVSTAIKRLLAFEGDYITIAKTKDAENNDCFAFFRIDKGTDLANFDDDQAKIDEISGDSGYLIYSSSEWWAYRGASGLYDLSVEVDSNSLTNTYEPKFYSKYLAKYGENDYEYETFVSKSGLVYVKIPVGKVFYMGDNRAHSTDARERGFADRSQIVGRCEFIVKDFNFGNRILSVIKFYFKQVEEFFAR